MGRKPRWDRDAEKRKIDREVKEEICDLIRRIALNERWNQKELARRLGTSEARVSYIIRYYPEQITVDQLLIYLAVLRPGFRFLISP